MSVNIKVTGGFNIEWGHIDPKGNRRVKRKHALPQIHSGSSTMSKNRFLFFN